MCAISNTKKPKSNRDVNVNDAHEYADIFVKKRLNDKSILEKEILVSIREHVLLKKVC